jgi:hypothetical protein
MRFTSLVIELIRARPRLVVWIVVLFQAALWLILPVLLYRSPPGDLATVLAYGREYQVEPFSARRWRSGSAISRFAPRAIICSASICWRSFAGSRRSGRSICWRAPLSADNRRCSRFC